MTPYERANIARLSAYVPGEQPRAGRWIKLNTNENPYPPAPAVMRAIAQVAGEQLRRYPPPNADDFCQVAAKLHRVRPEQIIATNGGDELLRLLVTVFCRPNLVGKKTGAKQTGAGGMAVAEPSYSLYPVLADIHEASVFRVPLKEDWSLPADFAKRALAAGCKLALLVHPHAPSGHVEPLDKLAKIARQLQKGGCVLVIDQAYVNFSDSDALPLVRKGMDNVILLRTLSKGYSLAGLRFGYGIGHAKLIEALNKAKDSYPTDILAQRAATAALQSQIYAAGTWKKIVKERAVVRAGLRQRGWQVPESGSNFLLAQPPAAGPGAKSIYESLKAQGVFVRYFEQDRLQDRLRITIGTPAQNKQLLRLIDQAGDMG